MTIGKEFEVSFSILPTLFPSNIKYSNVIRFTTNINENCCDSGWRVPGVWFYNNDGRVDARKLYISFDVNDNGNYKVITDRHRYLLNYWIMVSIGQYRVDDGSYIYYVDINGDRIREKVNSRPKVYHGVTVFAGDPVHEVQEGWIQNLKIKSGSFTFSILNL